MAFTLWFVCCNERHRDGAEEWRSGWNVPPCFFIKQRVLHLNRWSSIFFPQPCRWPWVYPRPPCASASRWCPSAPPSPTQTGSKCRTGTTRAGWFMEWLLLYTLHRTSLIPVPHTRYFISYNLCHISFSTEYELGNSILFFSDVRNAGKGANRNDLENRSMISMMTALPGRSVRQSTATCDHGLIYFPGVVACL